MCLYTPCESGQTCGSCMVLVIWCQHGQLPSKYTMHCPVMNAQQVGIPVDVMPLASYRQTVNTHLSILWLAGHVPLVQSQLGCIVALPIERICPRGCTRSPKDMKRNHAQVNWYCLIGCSQLLVSGNEHHAQEQLWLLQLLASGLQAPHDAPLYR